MYEGDFKENFRHGKGRFVLDNEKLLYEGDYVANKYEGHGTQYFEDGGKYEGAMHNGERNGIGAMTFPDGTIDCGLWANGKFVQAGLD